jgi:hypothetical protein
MGWKFENYQSKNFISHHSDKKKRKSSAILSSWKLTFSQRLHYSQMMHILLCRAFVSAFNSNDGGDNGLYFLCCCSCTNGKIASSCQLCDGYCYNGGTCQLDPETNVPVCLWVFCKGVGRLCINIESLSIALLSWGHTC